VAWRSAAAGRGSASGRRRRGQRGRSDTSEGRPETRMIVFGGGEGPRFVGGGRGCLIMLLVSIVLSLLLTVAVNLLLRLL
jgi:hypothetical protein